MEQHLSNLASKQTQFLQLLRDLSHEENNTQYHRDLSPLGWHLGHCVYTEIYWLREIVLGGGVISDDIKSLYIPELSPKSKRGDLLPSADDLLYWAEATLAENLQQFNQLDWNRRGDPLLDDYYLLRFLDQHYAQHLETARYIVDQMELQDPDLDRGSRLTTIPLSRDSVHVNGGARTIGYSGPGFCYDNELPVFPTELGPFDIASRPLSHGEYLSFVADAGYDNTTWWTTQGWQWRQQQGINAPMHWRYSDSTGWLALNLTSRDRIVPETPLFGISQHEATAFCNWAGVRLPHEYEWETACREGRLLSLGECWEWCGNTFHPYHGFSAWPYDGYSLPWFDGKHFVLRGSSTYSQDCIRRPSFRNYYLADKRHINAGCRPVFT